jgi:hypothetical protein
MNKTERVCAEAASKHLHSVSDVRKGASLHAHARARAR